MPFPFPHHFGIIVDGGLAALIAAAVGVWISAYSSTTRQAQQILSSVALLLMLTPLMLHRVIPLSLATLMATHNLTRLQLQNWEFVRLLS